MNDELLNDIEIDALMTKACSTDRGKLKASFVLHDLNKLTPIFANPATRAHAERSLLAMGECSDPLRKSLAMQWLARARSSIAGGAARGLVAGASAGRAVASGASRGAAVARTAVASGADAASRGAGAARSGITSGAQAASRGATAARGAIESGAARAAVVNGAQAAGGAARRGASAAVNSVGAARSAISSGASAAVHRAGAATGVTAAGKAIAGGYERASGKAGDLGAAAGERLARSPLNAKRMAAAQRAGGEAARGRMAERLAPGPGPGPRGPFLGAPIPGRARLEHAPAPRMGAPAQAAADPHAGMRPGFVDPAPPSFQSQRGPAPLPVADRVAAVHADALAGAYKSGAASAANAHAGAAAKMGRVAARHGFKAGMQLAGAGAAVAAAGTVGGAMNGGGLSEAEHQERVDAARAPRHHRGVAG